MAALGPAMPAWLWRAKEVSGLTSGGQASDLAAPRLHAALRFGVGGQVPVSGEQHAGGGALGRLGVAGAGARSVPAADLLGLWRGSRVVLQLREASVVLGSIGGPRGGHSGGGRRFSRPRARQRPHHAVPFPLRVRTGADPEPRPRTRVPRHLTRDQTLHASVDKRKVEKCTRECEGSWSYLEVTDLLMI